jgi:hypothetical protein
MIQNTSKPWSIVLPLPINFEKTGNLGSGLLFLMSLSTIFQLKCISWQSVRVYLFYCTGLNYILVCFWGRRSRDHMVVGFTTIYAISAYHH